MDELNIVGKLKDLIEDYENEKRYYDDMVQSWEKYDDPGSDPGLQFEQGEKVEQSWYELNKFISDNFKKIINI